MRTLALSLLALLLAGPASAISLAQAQAEADAWILARKDVILDRVTTCVQESTSQPKGSECHTGWAASVTANTAPADVALATQTLDDPGYISVDACSNECATGLGTFALAGIAIPGTAPVNAKVDVAKGPEGWGAQVQVRIQYDGAVYERSYVAGVGFTAFDWRELEVP